MSDLNEISELLDEITRVGLGYEFKTLEGGVVNGEDRRVFSLVLSSSELKITLTGGKSVLLESAPMLIGTMVSGQEKSEALE